MKKTALSRVNMIIAVLVAAVILGTGVSFPSYAAKVQDSGKKVSFLSGLNAWDAGSLTSGERNFLKYIVGIVDSGQSTTVHEASASDMSGFGGNVSKGDFSSMMRKDMDIILNVLCGNAYYNQVANGVTMNMYFEADSAGNINDSSRVAKVEAVVDQAGAQALSGANERYKAAINKLSGLLQTEAGITLNDSQVEALTKINNWLVANFSYDTAATTYTVEQTLDTKRGVCGQYSQIVKYSCDYLGINCDLIADSNMVHAYNRVYIDGTPYYIDATWNITNKNPDGWFLKTTAEFAVDHTIP